MGEFRLRVGPVWTELAEGDRETVDKLLTIADPMAATSASVAARLTDGLIHYFDSERPNAFLGGLTWRLQQRLEKRGHTVVLDYDPEPFDVASPGADCLDGVTMRPNQVDCLAAALRYRRGLLWEATNFGKTEVISALCLVLCRGAHPGLIVAPNTTILHEIRSRLAKRTPHLRVGIVGDQQRKLTGCDVVVATYQTMQQACPSGNRKADATLRKLVELCPFVLVDEAHHAGGAVYQRLLKMAYNATHRLGFSGSVDKKTRRDDAQAIEKSAPAATKHRWDVEAVLGPVLHRTTNQEQIEKGYSARPRVFVIDDRKAYGCDVAPVPMVPGKKMSVYNETFIRAVIRDTTYHRTVARVVRRLIVAGKPPFVFSHSVEHLKALSLVLKERNVPHRVLVGTSKTLHRNAVVEMFAKQQDFALLASSIFDEGANVPEIRAVVFAGARKAVVELLQRLGRGIRAKEDNTITVVDFRPSHCSMLVDHYEERRAVYRSEGFPVSRIVDITRLSEVDL